MSKRTALALGLLTLGLLPLACGDSDSSPDSPYTPPTNGGSGGWDPGDGGTSASGGNGGNGASAGSGGTSGTGGDLDGGPDQEAGPPACADEYKRCEHEFTYPAGSETSVEVRGSFAEDGWDQGVALTKNGSSWSATVPIPYDFQITYKFVIDGDTWVIDPNNPDVVPDGQGGEKSVLEPQICSWWSCVSDPAPGDCPESVRTCDFKFVYPYGGESSVTLKGSFDNWGAGIPMTQDGQLWTATADDLAWGSDVEYKFLVNGTDWVSDPNNPNTVGPNNNSLLSNLSCEWWACEGAVNPDAFDWRDAVLYFVFTDRFNNGDPSNDGSPTGNGVEPAADYQGGDFAGITAKINEGYFNDLGVNVLWISPPMDNTSEAGAGVGGDTHMYSAYHGYWVSDPEKTEERFGTMAELQAMVDAAHANDIRVLFDYPMNHVHEDSPVYAQHSDWFWQPPCICGAGCSWDGAEGKKCWFTDYLPDFDFTNAEARDWSVSNALWWVEQTGIDGFRLDAVKHIEDQWILDLRSRLDNEVEPVT
ncbi:MAG: alpha-amylase family glycosyl hydrolase, partial [Myxococcota bacterium]